MGTPQIFVIPAKAGIQSAPHFKIESPSKFAPLTVDYQSSHFAQRQEWQKQSEGMPHGKVTTGLPLSRE